MQFRFLLDYYFISQVPFDTILFTSTNLVYVFIYLSGNIPPWVIFLKILLSNDVEKNPGDFKNGFFNFCNWNFNSLTKDNFQRSKILEAHDSIFDYDLISLCETNLNNSVVLPNDLIEMFTFLSCDSQTNGRHRGVGLFYKHTLPLKVRDDLTFEETIVVELKFFTLIYRSPSFNDGSIEFETFLINLGNLFNNIKNENPYVMIFTGDFNGHSELW